MTAETEETTDETTETTSEETQTDDKPSGHDRLPDDHPVVKALNKANEEAKEYRLKVKEYEDRDKTDEERRSEKLSTLEKDLTAAQADAVRFEIALEKGLTKNQAKRLVGSTREELEADAAELIEDLGLDEQGEKPAGRPKEKLKPGASREDDDDQVDGDKIAEKILARNRI